MKTLIGTWWLLSGMVALGAAGEDGSNVLRVGFFYNSRIYSDGALRTNVERILQDRAAIETFTVDYEGPADFRRLYLEFMQTNAGRCDLVLGPTESAALKELNDVLTNRQSIPFLAPFITTSADEYPNVHLTTATPSDRERVKTAVERFVNYTEPRTVAIVHTEDLWGRSMVEEFRAMLGSPETIVHAQPVQEFTGTEFNGTNDYKSFIAKIREHGATVVGIALLTEEAANAFLKDLADFNASKWLPYKPTILLLSHPRFDKDNTKDGILFEHAQAFNVLYVRNCLKANGRGGNGQQEALAPYFDACQIIARAARTWSNSMHAESGESLVVHHILKFYKKEWPAELRDATLFDLITGFHADRLGFTNRVMAVTRATLRGGKVENQSVDSYFQQGPLRGLYYSSVLFLEHHPVLWNFWTLILFIGFALLSFFHVIHLKSEKPPWILLRTGPFWSLFALNFLLTYIVWILSIRFGVFGDTNVGAALTLAAACPTAGSALSDMIRRYVPMIDLTGIIRILERLNEQMLDHIGREKLDALTARLEELGAERIKSAFFEVLLLKLASVDLRTRIREQLRTKLHDAYAELERMQKDFVGTTRHQIEVERDRLERKIYAASLLNALGYLCSSGNELSAWVEDLLASNHTAATI